MYGSGVRNKSCFQPGPLLRNESGSDLRKVEVQMDDQGQPDTVARITQLDPRTYGASFKSHTGRWDPLPEEGTRDEMIAVLAEELGPYFDPANY
jgi:hypothetical protein